MSPCAKTKSETDSDGRRIDVTIQISPCSKSETDSVRRRVDVTIQMSPCSKSETDSAGCKGRRLLQQLSVTCVVTLPWTETGTRVGGTSLVFPPGFA